MKKIFTLILFAVIGMNSFAQIRGQLNIDYGNHIAFNKDSDMFQGTDYIIQYGLRPCEDMFFGAGVGISTMDGEYGIPIHINFRYYAVPLNNVSPYVSIVMGYSENLQEELGGWNAGLDFGCNMFIGNNTFLNLSIGPMALWLENGSFGGIQFKIGISI